jgi:hypothetical protein
VKSGLMKMEDSTVWAWMRRRLSLTLALCLVWTQSAGAWTCRNGDFEIRCTAASCVRENDFTPMSISVSEHGEVSACAYSGCWEGRATTVRGAGRYLFVSGNFAWKGTTGSSEDLAIVVDRKEGIATFVGDGFANPMTCTK